MFARKKKEKLTYEEELKKEISYYNKKLADEIKLFYEQLYVARSSDFRNVLKLSRSRSTK